MSFTNKVVIVTGGSSGIGATIALQFAKKGADVAIVGRNAERLEKEAEKCSKVGKKPLTINADVSKEEDAKSIIKKTVDKYSKIDVLVNNAGVFKLANVTDKKLLEVYDFIMGTNLKSVVMLTNLAAPYLMKTKGNIVNMSSVSGSTVSIGPGYGQALYGTSKAAIDYFTRSCAKELAEHGVRVNAISPGPVQTPILSNDLEVWTAFCDRYTALRLLTQPEEVADMVLYLASDKARSITGANILIDAGIMVNAPRI